MGDYKHVGRRLAQSTRANIVASARGEGAAREKADIRGHDLRRTAASLMTSGGVPRFVVSRILNHSEEKDITSVYDRYSYDAEKRAAMARWPAGNAERRPPAHRGCPSMSDATGVQAVLTSAAPVPC
jgi:integrase